MISFVPLTNSHFTLLLKWLKTAHVKTWWDTDKKWDIELIKEKYEPYVKRYKCLKLKDKIIKKPIYAFIIYNDNQPIGYIQYYNKYDFPLEQEYDISGLPNSCAGLDWYIGELSLINKGMGSQALALFIEQFVFKNFSNILLDPDTTNLQAIRVYEKIGFIVIKKVNNGQVTLMLKARKNL